MDAVTEGTLVAERYRLIRQIGFGGMGTVWLTYDEALASHCAVKLLLPEPRHNEELEIRLECEAKCAAQLRSPHVVDVFNRGRWQGKPFIVMEYLEGEDLSARLSRVGHLDGTTTYRIVAQVARALMRAHSLGIVHRDIKPANIFLVPGEEHEIAKVLDFGIAKHCALPNAFENPQAASFIGTPCYMSPEQVRGETADYRSDLWALAMITFECLTGSLPFPDDSVHEVVRAITAGNLPALTANHPELPSALEAWWRRATAANAEQRFQSAKDFADALGDVLEAFPKLPISRAGSHADAEANTLLAPPELAPVSPRVVAPPKVVERDADSTLRARELRARTHPKSSRRDSLRVPMHSHRALTIAGAAACAVLGFAASSFSAELGLNELARRWPHVSQLIDEPSETPPKVITTSASAVDTEVAPNPPGPIVPVALQVTPETHVDPPRPSTSPSPSAPVEVRPAPRPVKPAQSSSARLRREPSAAINDPSSREPTPDLPGELIDSSTVEPGAAQERAADAPLPRVMPPGEKDYGI